MLLRMSAPAVCRIREPQSRGSLVACGAVVAHISPEQRRLRLAGAGSKHWDRRVIGVQLGCRQYMSAHLIDERCEQMAGSSHPVSKRRAIELDAFASIDLRLAIEGKMICILREQHMRQKTWPGQSPVYRSRRRRCFDDHIALRAAQLRPHVADDLEA